MKTFMLMLSITLPSVAQDFRGVSIGGTLDQPTIVNQSGQAVIGWAIRQNFATHSSVKAVLDMPLLIKNEPIMPGEERIAGVSSGGFGSRTLRDLDAVRDSVILQAPPEKLVSLALTAVLFRDGSFIGPDREFQNFSSKIAEWRRAARDAQYRPERYELMEADRREMFRTGRITPLGNMAIDLLGIREAKGEAEAEAALARLAVLPEVVRGENQ